MKIEVKQSPKTQSERAAYFSPQHLAALFNSTFSLFRKVLKTHTIFHFIFIAFLFLECFYLFIHLSLFTQTFTLAIHLALIFITLFSYLTLRMYFKTKKQDQLIEIKEEFLKVLRQEFEAFDKEVDRHLFVSHACCQFVESLEGKESSFYSYPMWLSPISYFNKFTRWAYWEDFLFFKELFLKAVVAEHIQLVKLKPTDLQVHAQLANAYIMLSRLYINPTNSEEEKSMSFNKRETEFQEKFKATAAKAIEEFKILSHYAPHDPWVHSQLAYSYHDLHMPQEEIKEYEIILQLCPEDKDALFKLGKLYFEQGLNAKGLQAYEILKKAHARQAEYLISFYGN